MTASSTATTDPLLTLLEQMDRAYAALAQVTQRQIDLAARGRFTELEELTRQRRHWLDRLTALDAQALGVDDRLTRLPATLQPRARRLIDAIDTSRSRVLAGDATLTHELTALRGHVTRELDRLRHSRVKVRAYTPSAPAHSGGLADRKG